MRIHAAHKPSNFTSPPTVIPLAILLICLLTTLSSTLSAQDFSMAKISEKGVLALPLDKKLSDAYLIDMSSYHFKSDDEMILYMNERGSNLYLMRARTTSKQAVLELMLSEKPDWKIEQWNNYLKMECETNPFRK